MLTLFCLVVFQLWPHDVGIPLWMLLLSLALDIMVAASRERGG